MSKEPKTRSYLHGGKKKQKVFDLARNVLSARPMPGPLARLLLVRICYSTPTLQITLKDLSNALDLKSYWGARDDLGCHSDLCFPFRSGVLAF